MHSLISRPAILLSLIAVAATGVAAGGEALPPGQYVTVREGHLFHCGTRLRLWGVNFCHSIKRQGKDLELCFDRLAFCGFNGVRLNYSSYIILGHDPLKDSFTVPVTVAGSGSDIDRLDHSIYLAKQRGMFFWFSFNIYRNFLPADYDALPPDGARDEWLELIKEASVPYLVYIDPRAEGVFQRYAANVLNHLNPYTGKRYADEEAIGLYEIFNEDGFIDATLAGPHTGVVAKRLSALWNRWLQRRYGGHSRLVRAWGAVNEGEDLGRASVAFAPLVSQAGEYPKARGEDVMRFVYDLYFGFTDRFSRFVRFQGKPGVGISVVPITPTGRFANSLAAYYAASARGDFVSVGNYGFAMRPWEVSKADPLYPWVVRVNAPPMLETPIDCVRAAGKPYLVYETNDYRPNPYTVEFPMRAAANAIHKDADGVFWFTWDDSGYLQTLATDEDYVSTRLPMPDASYPNAGLVLCNDEVELAGIKAAGDLFRFGQVPAARRPVTAVIGRDVLLNLGQHETQPLYSALNHLAWRQGLEVRYDPEGPTVIPGVGATREQPHRVRTGREIAFDWGHGRGTIRINAPAAKAAVGFNGTSVRLGDVSFTGLDRDFTCLSLVARDGLPLTRSADILLTMASRCANTGFALDPAMMKAEWGAGLAQAIVNGGGPPVVADRVAGTVSASWLRGRWVQKLDFARVCYEQGRIGEGLVIAPGEPLFFARITPGPPPPVVRKVLIIGNSLTRHGKSEGLGWPYDCGMAATGEERDYAHLFYQQLCRAQPEPRPELQLAAPSDEAHMRGIEHLLPTDADVAIIQLGDNFRGAVNEEELQKPYAAMVAALRQSGVKRIYCLSSWGNVELDKYLHAGCEAEGARWVNITPIAHDGANRAAAEGHFTHGGVNWHPGDRGMARIAEALWAEVRKLFGTQ